MQPKRIQELLQIIGKEVNSTEDFRQFLEKYGSELDQDFLIAVAFIVKRARESGEESIAAFFMRIIEVVQVLLSLRQVSQGVKASSGFSGAEVEIESENYRNDLLVKINPNEAYIRAGVNLERARQTRNDFLICTCAFILGLAAHNFRPYPKVKEAIQAYELASEKALATGNKPGYVAAQNSLGLAYTQLPTDARGENFKKAISCYQNALQVRTEKDFPRDFALTQNSLGVAYAQLPTGDRGENLKNAISCYQNALRVYTERDFPQYFAMAQNYLGLAYLAYADLPTGDRGENLKNAFACFQNALRIYTEKDFPQDFAGIQNNFALAYIQLPTGDREENLKNAISCCHNALRVYLEKDSPYEYAATQNTIGNAHFQLPTGEREENLKNAISYYQNALRVYTLNAFPHEYARTQNNLGTAYSKLLTGDRGENLKNAISCYQNALQVYGEKNFPHEYGAIHYNLGAIYADLTTGGDRGENLKNAISCYQKVLRVRTKNAFPREYATAQNNLGNVYLYLPTGDRGENLKNAIAYYENALTVRTKKDFPKEYAETQNNLGNAYAALPTGNRGENLKNAIAYYENALELITEQDFPQDYAATQNNLGVAYGDLPTGDRGENLNRAIYCYQNALRVYNEKDFPCNYSGTQNNLGFAYANLPGNRRENLEEAISCYRKALTVRTEEDFPQDYAMTQNNLGVAYTKLPTEDRWVNLTRAIFHYENALRALRREKNFSQSYVQTMNNLSVAYADLPSGAREKNLKIAISFYQDALRIYTEKDFPQYFAIMQNNLGTAYTELATGDRRENFKNAIAYFENSLRIRTKEAFPKDCVDTLYNLTLAYDDSDDKQNAYKTCAEAIEVLETRIRALSYAETRRAIAENQANLYHRMVSLCIRLGKIEEALSYAERGKSRTLVEMLHSAQLQPSEKVPEKVREAFLAVRNKLEELRYLREAGETATPRDFETRESSPESEKQRKTPSFTQRIRRILPFGKREKEQVLPAKEINSVPVSYDSPRVEIWKLIDEAQNAYNQLLEQIRRHDREFAALERVQPISVAEINALIPEKTVFVECFTGHDGTYIFVLDGKSDVKDTYIVLKDLTAYNLFTEFAIRNWLDPYYDDMNERTAEKHQAWFNAIENTPRLLAEKFWYAEDTNGRSLASLVEKSKAEQIVFIPHSELHLLPLHLIPLSSENGQLLMDKYEIAYSPSVSMLRFKLKSDNTQERNSLFAVANPDRSLCVTDYEVERVSGHFKEKNILWYEEATKKATLDQAGKGSIVHFSCHGSFQDANPLDSKLILAEGDNLTLKEIFAKLKIPKADAVVLSACETGMVKLERGDEYIGLTSGFMYEGSPTVISSLWSVDDLSTSLLMNRWYENVLTNKMGKSAALKEAQQWVRGLTLADLKLTLDELSNHLEKHSCQDPDVEKRIDGYRFDAEMTPEEKPFAHPYYWGAFTCNGNWM
jgi:CHAT domain-containing protein